MSGKLHQKNFIDGFGFQKTRVITIFRSTMLLFLLSIPFLLHAQTPEWVYQYIHPDAFGELPYKIIADSLGSTYTTGSLSSDDTTGGHIIGVGVIKLSTHGEEQWIYFNDTLGRITEGYDAALRNSKVYATGYTGPSSNNNPIFMVLCIDTSGQRQWIYTDTTAIRGNAISVSSSHMIYAGGYTLDFNIICAKLDSLGNEKWRYVYDGPAASYDEATDIIIDSEENIYIGGYSTGVGTSTDFTVIKLDSAGNEKWVYRYDGPANYRDEIEIITLDTLGNIYMTGWSWGIDWDFCVVKIDSLGQEQWVYRYNGPANWADFSFDIAVDDTGNVYMAGRSMRQDTVSLFTVVKLDSGGNEQWMYSTSGPLDTGGAAQHIVLDGLGNIYAAGFFYGIAVVKLTPAGDTLWTYIHPRGGTFDIVADVNGNIYATGRVGVSVFDYDIVVLKFACENVTQESSKKYMNNNTATISKNGIKIFLSQNSMVYIFDVAGRALIKKFAYQTQEIYFNLQPGVYFLQIEGGESTTTKKIIVL